MSSLRVRYVCQQRVSGISSPFASDRSDFSNEPLSPSLEVSEPCWTDMLESSVLAIRHETNGRILPALESHEFLLNTYLAGVS